MNHDKLVDAIVNTRMSFATVARLGMAMNCFAKHEILAEEYNHLVFGNWYMFSKKTLKRLPCRYLKQIYKMIATQ